MTKGSNWFVYQESERRRLQIADSRSRTLTNCARDWSISNGNWLKQTSGTPHDIPSYLSLINHRVESILGASLFLLQLPTLEQTSNSLLAGSLVGRDLLAEQPAAAGGNQPAAKRPAGGHWLQREPSKQDVNDLNFVSSQDNRRKMAPRTIAERAAAGENLNARDLTREEQVELLIWARQRQPPMTYQEIIRRYGFTQSEGLLRTWYMVRTNNNPPRVATFTAEDDELLRRAVALFATGPLDDENSLRGIWPSVRNYIRKNGAATTAGVQKLKERWEQIGNQDGTAPAGRAKARLGSSFRVPKVGAQSQPTTTAQTSASQAGTSNGSSSVGARANADLTWEEYDPLSENEMREVMGGGGGGSSDEGSSDEGSDGSEWGEYEPLSDSEMREVLGEADSDDQDSAESGSD
ncbi:hypothetical protein LA080_008181 [Diaporthe eres]|nr:hypothetical protein LA080_008181 [Diaporthe eres]